MRILCFESGGTKLIAALADESGKLVASERVYRRPGQRAVDTLRFFTEAGARIAAGQKLDAVAFGYGGTVRRDLGRPGECFHEPGWEGLDPRSKFEAAFHAPAFIENDCNLAALAEAILGFQIPAHQALLYVTLGTGIGAGVVIGRRLLELSPVGEAELGHVVVEETGPLCSCGNRGCLETFCAGPALARLASSSLDRKTDARELMALARAGQRAALQLLDQAAERFAKALAPAANLFAPAIIVFGGGVMTDNRFFLERIQERTHPRIFPPFARSGIRFELSRLGEGVVCQGACLYALHRLRGLEPAGHI